MTKKETEKVVVLDKTKKVIEDIKVNPLVDGYGKEPIGEKPKVEVPKVEDLQKEIERLQKKVTNKSEEANRVHDKLEAFEKADKEKALATLQDAIKKAGALKSDANDPNAPTFDALIASGKLPGNGKPDPEDLEKAKAVRDAK